MRKRNLKSQRRKGTNPKQKSTTTAPDSLRTKYVEAYLTSLTRDAEYIFEGHYSNADATLDRVRIKSRLGAEGLFFATNVLPRLMSGFLGQIEDGHASFPGFKLKRGTKHPAFLGRIFHLAYYSTDLALRVKATDFLYTFSVAFKKLRGDYSRKVIREFFADFVKTDTSLGKIDFFSKELRPVLEDARQQWRIFVETTGLLDRINCSKPQPGPGATNSPTKKNERYSPHVFYRSLDAVMPYSEWFYPDPLLWLHSEALTNGFYYGIVSRPTARFKTVPKVVGKPRGICIEENETQCLQQAVRKALYDAITEYFGDNIALRKQAVNARLALESSRTRDDATIDESEASDRVARLLVSYLSQDDMQVSRILLGLSTELVVPPDECKDDYNGPIRIHKFAPMGSALCFPVMSLVHMFLIRAIVRLSAPHDVSALVNRIYVYGDDIVLPSQCVDAVYEWLPKFGMKINKDKSFVKSHFRESCGVHAFHGVNITPVYIKYIPYQHDPGAQASVFAVEEQLFNKGLWHTAEFQRQAIEKVYGVQPYVPSGLSLAGYARSHDDPAVKDFKKTVSRGWSRSYQCRKLTLTRFTKHKEKLVIKDQLDAYTRWMWESDKDFNSDVVCDSLGDLTKSTRSVLESALAGPSLSEKVFELCRRFPTANARITHPTRLGRSTRYIASAGERCYC